MKRKGFTLIELVVVIALIAILAVTLAPRLRDQIAKANDAKAIAVLGSFRTQSEIYFADTTRTVASTTPSTVTVLEGDGTTSKAATTAWDILIDNLDNSSKDLFAEAAGGTADWKVGDNEVPVGGYRKTGTAKVEYSGTRAFTFVKPGGSTTFDGISIWFAPKTDQELDTKGTNWSSY